MLTRIRRLLHTDDGITTLWFVVTGIALIALVGVIIDTAGYNQARIEADAAADAAARAGANSLDSTNSILGSAPSIGYTSAQAVQNYAATTGYNATSTYTGNEITATLTTTYTPALLSIIGIGDLPVTATGRAALISE